MFQKLIKIYVSHNNENKNKKLHNLRKEKLKKLLP
jgi:hypothetical protein